MNTFIPYQVLNGRTQARTFLQEQLRPEDPVTHDVSDKAVLNLYNERDVPGRMTALSLVPENGTMTAALDTDGSLQVFMVPDSRHFARVNIPLGTPVDQPLTMPCTHVRLEQSDRYPGKTILVLGHPGGYTGYLVADGTVKPLEPGYRLQ